VTWFQRLQWVLVGAAGILLFELALIGLADVARSLALR